LAPKFEDLGNNNLLAKPVHPENIRWGSKYIWISEHIDSNKWSFRVWHWLSLH
jgi:hypothetical protein